MDDEADGVEAAAREDESVDATLRRTLYELQGLNKLFDKLLGARKGVNAVHEVRLVALERTRWRMNAEPETLSNCLRRGH